MTITLSHKMLITGALAIAFVAPAFAHAESGSNNTTQMREIKERGSKHASSTKERRASSTVDRTCMATAVATREAAIKTAWGTFSTSITTGLDKRSTSLSAAWNASAEGSREAIKKAWSDWKKDRQTAGAKLKADRKAAWDTFRKTAKDSCKVSTPKEEGLEKSGSDSIAL